MLLSLIISKHHNRDCNEKDSLVLAKVAKEGGLYRLFANLVKQGALVHDCDKLGEISHKKLGHCTMEHYHF